MSYSEEGSERKGAKGGSERMVPQPDVQGGDEVRLLRPMSRRLRRVRRQRGRWGAGGAR